MDYTKTNTNVYKKKSNVKKYSIIFLCAFLVLGSAIFFATSMFLKKLNSNPTIYSLKKNWNKKQKTYEDYLQIYDIANEILKEDPFNNTVLTYKGYAAFYLGVYQTDSSLQQEYLDSAINSLRLSLSSANKSLQGQVSYMLGLSYFHKNTGSSYHYADLAIKYLEEAKKRGYKKDDIYEYLGLCYAWLNMPMDSISSLTEALLVRESDTLLLLIAEQYTKQKQFLPAKQYLHRVIENSENDSVILKSCLLLGSIYIEEEQFEEAEKVLNTVLEKDINNADAYYQFGILHQKQGDAVKARSSFRRALRLQPNHEDALKRISEIK